MCKINIRSKSCSIGNQRVRPRERKASARSAANCRSEGKCSRCYRDCISFQLSRAHWRHLNQMEKVHFFFSPHSYAARSSRLLPFFSARPFCFRIVFHACGDAMNCLPLFCPTLYLQRQQLSCLIMAPRSAMFCHLNGNFQMGKICSCVDVRSGCVQHYAEPLLRLFSPKPNGGISKQAARLSNAELAKRIGAE